MDLFTKTAYDCSKIITNNYSTSFSLGIRSLAKSYHQPIYAIYGFVRFADEIVDTFHEQNKAELLERFIQETNRALADRISLNPVLHAFQIVVHEYSIRYELIDAFLHSMKMDLHDQKYDTPKYNQYIYGSAEVVGLMCLAVFCKGNKTQYEELKPFAQRLGAAFQKVNFLRDMQSDYIDRGRTYFPGIDLKRFDHKSKKAIEIEIAADFEYAAIGIKKLPRGARFGVYLAYVYYLQLFRKIKRLPPESILHKRIRVSNFRKILLLLKGYLEFKLSATW